MTTTATTTATTTEVAVYDEGVAALLMGMVREEDRSKQSIPVMRINYEEDAAYPKGAWVVGQQKNKDGEIIDEGKPVAGLVILTTQNRFAYYVKKDVSKNCSSPFHNMGETVRGNNYNVVCGAGCANREKDLQPRCKAQKVVFGVAICEDGSHVDCVTYIQGQSYPPFLDYFKTLTKAKIKAGYVEIPPFARVTLLSSEKHKYDATTYFVAKFQAGDMLGIETIKEMEIKRDVAVETIARLNRQYASGLEPEAIKVTVETRGTKAVVVEEDDIPFNLGSVAKVSAEPPTIEASVDEDDFDIDAAIRMALKK